MSSGALISPLRLLVSAALVLLDLFCPLARDRPGERLELLGSGGLQEDDAGVPDNVWEYPGTSEVRVQCRDEAPEDPYVRVRSAWKLLPGMGTSLLAHHRYVNRDVLKNDRSSELFRSTV